MRSLASENTSLLEAKAIVCGYRNTTVLRGVSIDVAEGEIVAIIGHNGAGKSTLVKTLFGLIPLRSGQIILGGKTLIASTPKKMLRAGVSYVPQGSHVFSDLTVAENLEIGGITLSGTEPLRQQIERVLTLFPDLRRHFRQKAGTLSGGEKQLLALGIALILTPRLLLLDEPSLGLAPALVGTVLAHIQRLNSELGISVLIVEQKVRQVLKISNRVFVLRNGSVSFSGLADSLRDETLLREAYL